MKKTLVLIAKWRKREKMVRVKEEGQARENDRHKFGIISSLKKMKTMCSLSVVKLNQSTTKA